jgi:hypothetical protein
MQCVWTMRGSGAVATRQCWHWIGPESKKLQMRRDRVDGLQSLLSCAPTECMRCVLLMRGSDAVATRPCGDCRDRVEKVTNAERPSGGTPRLAFMRFDRERTVCLDDARQFRARGATIWGLDRARVEKVTNAARPSGGTPKLAFMCSDRAHAVCLDDARQWRGRDATVWGLYRVKVEKVTNAARPSGGTPKIAFMRCDRVCGVSGRCEAVARS